MKLKLDLHAIYNDSPRIEEALQSIIDEAVTKRASEVEIIPGKGSGALKNTVIRFLERQEVKSRYHRIEKDGDNWGRLFVHFRHNRAEPSEKHKPALPELDLWVACACCQEQIGVPELEADGLGVIDFDCLWCGSPNRVSSVGTGRETSTRNRSSTTEGAGTTAATWATLATPAKRQRPTDPTT